MDPNIDDQLFGSPLVLGVKEQVQIYKPRRKVEF